MSQIQLQQVGKQFRAPGGATLKVLDGIDLTVATGEVVGLLGPSGCGKSTLLNIIAGLDTAHDGAMTVQGRPMREQLGAVFRVSYVFQESRLLPWYTLEKNLEFVLEAGDFPRSEWEGRIARVLDAVGLTTFRRYYPGQLSGGMQQRASIARAFCIDPDILLLDEPFSALDELTARKLRQSLLQLWEQFRTTIVFVSHNAYEATFLADRLLVMGGGRIDAEIDLRDMQRPRSYDDTRLFERSKQVLQTLEGAGTAPAGRKTAAMPASILHSAH
jgi:NitT/TauT family transport system ATP-binding protein